MLHTWYCVLGASYLVCRTWCFISGASNLALNNSWCFILGAAYWVLSILCFKPVASRLQHMQAFSWNEAQDSRAVQAELAAVPDVLCPICGSPFTDAELQASCQVISLQLSAFCAVHQTFHQPVRSHVQLGLGTAAQCSCLASLDTSTLASMRYISA